MFLSLSRTQQRMHVGFVKQKTWSRLPRSSLTPPVSSSRTLAHLTRRVADEFALVVQLVFHILRGGATNFEFGRRCYVYRARCPAKRACPASARCCAPNRLLALGPTSLSKAIVLAADQSTVFHSPALCSTPHCRSPFACMADIGPYFAMLGLLRLT